MTQETQDEQRFSQQDVEHDVRSVGRRHFFEIAGLTGVAAALASCGTIGQSAPVSSANNGGGSGGWGNGIHIRFFVGGDPGDAFASIVLKGAKQAQADLGANVDYIFSGWDVEKMTNQLREALAACPDGIAMMGHPGDSAIKPLAQQSFTQGTLMEYQNVDVPQVRSSFGGGYIGQISVSKASSSVKQPLNPSA